MTFPEIKLVDAPTATANVLFDFNDTTATPYRQVNADDFTIGVPSLEGDVDAIDPLYGERVVSFTCQMRGTKPQVAAAQSMLARRLLAPGQGWLQVRMSPTARLLFFRTYRPQPGDLSFDMVQTTKDDKRENWELEVDIPCEPFAYGERVTQAPQSFANTPDNAACTRIVLPGVSGVTGDATALLRVSVTPTNGDSTSGQKRWMLAYSQTPPKHVPIGTGDNLDAQTDTAAGTSNAAAAGGSVRRVNFSTNAGLVSRLTGDTPGGVSPGRHKVLLRTIATAAGSVFSARMGPASDGNFGGGDTKFIRQTSGWTDLGDFTLPASPPPAAEFSGGVSAPTRLNLQVGRVSGTASLDLDSLLFIPLSTIETSSDSRLLFATFPTPSTAAVTTYFDAQVDQYWSLVSGNVANVVVSELRGLLPAAEPGQPVYQTFLEQVDGFDGWADSISRTASIQVSHMPRFLYIGDS